MAEQLCVYFRLMALIKYSASSSEGDPLYDSKNEFWFWFLLEQCRSLYKCNIFHILILQKEWFSPALRGVKYEDRRFLWKTLDGEPKWREWSGPGLPAMESKWEVLKMFSMWQFDWSSFGSWVRGPWFSPEACIQLGKDQGDQKACYCTEDFEGQERC